MKAINSIIKNLISLLTITLILASCSTAKPLYNPAGQMYFTFRAREASRATADAIGDAEEVCEEKDKSVAILDQKSVYYGSMPEAEYLEWLRVSKFASALGGLHTDPLGNVGNRVGGATRAAISDCGYESTVSFECI